MAKKKTKKESTHEVFEVEKNGKVKEVQKDSTVDVPVDKPGQKKHNSKILNIVIIVCISILLAVLGLYYYAKSIETQSYLGLDFKAISEGDLIFYQTAIPYNYNGKWVPYNFYLRTSPKKIAKVPMDTSDFNLMKFAVLAVDENLKCNDGDDVIAIAQLVRVNKVIGVQVIKDKTASCDPEGRYSYYNVIESNETGIDKVGKNCYDIKVSNCEILPATERLVVQILSEYQNE